MSVITRAAISVARFVFRNYVYTVQHGLAKGLKRRGGFGFLPKSGLSKEERFLIELDIRGQTAYDIGGWEGVFTIFLARSVGQAGRVIVFEPNPLCQACILNNVQLSHFQNVQLHKIGLGQ